MLGVYLSVSCLFSSLCLECPWPNFCTVPHSSKRAFVGGNSYTIIAVGKFIGRLWCPNHCAKTIYLYPLRFSLRFFSILLIAQRPWRHILLIRNCGVSPFLILSTFRCLRFFCPTQIGAAGKLKIFQLWSWVDFSASVFWQLWAAAGGIFHCCSLHVGLGYRAWVLGLQLLPMPLVMVPFFFWWQSSCVGLRGWNFLALGGG